ncbi:GNAT family N-acetyltransferase [Thalassoglobus sp.]|uniref:GNAT family N-acetyltransferase n=1 Tax=Thalassoglobus sp. TaxID=2795869 RepID=UPI003AA7E1A1
MSAFSSKKANYLKRFRMEVDLRDAALPVPKLPEDFTFQPWHPATLPDHAFAKFESFQAEMDSQIFPALRSFIGCRELMQSIVTHSGFVPEATWLIKHEGTDFHSATACATIQGLSASLSVGAIQNIGVIPEYRGFGLGRALLLKNLHGFRACGFVRVYLDVSANNTAAISLYRSIGFKHIKTSYREVLPEPPAT